MLGNALRVREFQKLNILDSTSCWAVTSKTLHSLGITLQFFKRFACC